MTSNTKETQEIIPSQESDSLITAKAQYPDSVQALFMLGVPAEEPQEGDLSEYKALATEYSEQVEILVQIILDPAFMVDEDDESIEFSALDDAYWAPFHAMMLLYVLAPVEALEPLLGLFEKGQESSVEMLPDLFVEVGEPGIPILWKYIKDLSKQPDGRGFSIRTLGGIAEAHDSLKEGITEELCAYLKRDERDLNTEEEFVNASIIMALCDLHAALVKEEGSKESDPVLQLVLEAFEQDIVGDHVISLDDARIEFGLRAEWTDEERQQNIESPRISLQCDVCERIRYYDISVVYFDPHLEEKQETQEDPEYGPLLIPDSIICSKCGAKDKYTLSPYGHQTITIAAMMEIDVAENKGSEHVRHPFVKFVHFDSLGFGKHPYLAEQEFRTKLLESPTDARFYIDYAQLLMFLKKPELAEVQLTQALTLSPENPEVFYYLARLSEKDERLEEALAFWDRARSTALRDNSLPRQLKRSIIDEASTRLSMAKQEKVPKNFEGTKLRPNDRCPCGSGKKFKKCCMS